MIDKTKAFIGQTVFFEEFWSNNIIKGKISEIHDDGARVECECIVDKIGHDRDSFPGTCGGRWENLYPTAGDAYAGREKKMQDKTAQYEKEITDVKSLIKFALDHPLCAEEYTDHAAIEAYKRRSRDLLGIEL